MTNLAKLIIPHTKAGDRLYNWLKFVRKHRRFPSNKLIFNDVLYHLKQGPEGKNPLRAFVTDKEYVKAFIAYYVGDIYNTRTIAVLHTAAEVDSYVFPNACCIKPTHGSGMVVLRTSGQPIDLNIIKEWFHIDYYHISREPYYRYLKPKVIVEQLVFGNSNASDYKFHCYMGLPRFIQLDSNRHVAHRRQLYDLDWNLLPFGLRIEPSKIPAPKPANLAEMLEVCRMLAKHFDVVRIDLYSDGNVVHVGEITNCHEGASAPFVPPSAELLASKIMFEDRADLALTARIQAY